VTRVCNRAYGGTLYVRLSFVGPVSHSPYLQYVKAFFVGFTNPEIDSVGFAGPYGQGETITELPFDVALNYGDCADLGAYILIDPSLYRD